MPWSTQDTMGLRQGFALLARQEGCNRRELCRRFGISPQTDYRRLARYVESGNTELTGWMRRPSHSPMRIEAELEQAVIVLRQQHPVWGGHKVSYRLAGLDWNDVPAFNIATSILHRYELTTPEASDASMP